MNGFARLSSLVLALVSVVSATTAANPYLKPIQLTAPDNSVKASFIPQGAALVQFWMKDKHGKFRDIVLGYDNLTNYETLALGHPYFGPIVGRYANRIKNGTFSVDGHSYHISENENGGRDTLHGGVVGYDLRNWTIAAQTSSSVTFTLTDNGLEGFPGTVKTSVSYALEKGGKWDIKMHSTASQKTPIMLAGHQYWNLEAYEESQDLLGHYAQFDASRVIAGDGILIPNGTLFNVTGTPLDFHKAKSIGVSLYETTPYQYCGTGCTGFDNAWIYDNNTGKKPAFSMWSKNSGIRMDVTTDQTALQIYTCNGIFNATLPIPRKQSQGGPLAHYTKHSCIVIEQESWIDAINQPEWKIDQIYGPGRDYTWNSVYQFSVMKP